MAAAGRRLLVVDDDRDFADSLFEILDLSGYDVEVAYSGEEAMNLCRNSQFDLALMDVHMPGKDGVDSFIEIQKSTPDFRVIMMTGYSVPERLDQALSSGARAVVQKPLDADRLLELIEQHRGLGPVLVVDDDHDFVDSLCTFLEQAGYSTVVAHDGEEALARIDSGRPAVIILDLRMPNSNGLEFCRELERRSLSIPTLVVSAYISEETDTVRELRAHGTTAMLEKPFEMQQLLQMMGSVTRA